jgi:hypothetical protein
MSIGWETADIWLAATYRCVQAMEGHREVLRFAGQKVTTDGELAYRSTG